MEEQAIVSRIIKLLDKWANDIEVIAKELKRINTSEDESYRVSISKKAHSSNGRKDD